jgi:hypothetical protein
MQVELNCRVGFAILSGFKLPSCLPPEAGVDGWWANLDTLKKRGPVISYISVVQPWKISSRNS